MNLSSARAVLLTRRFETAAGPTRLLTDREWADCTRAGLGAPGAAASFEAFLVARAAAAGALLMRREPALAGLPAPGAGLAAAQALAIGLGLLAGLGTNLFNGSDRFNLFAPGVLAVLLWNLMFYGLLVLRALPHRPRPKPSAPGVVQRLAAWLEARAQRSPLQEPGCAAVLLAFMQDWQQASRSLLGVRAVATLHLAGAALALGVMLGMYGRGLVVEYRVMWGSTFIGATQAHAWLSGLLGPAALLTGIPLPDAAMLDALRHDASLSAAAVSAAPWIHLYAVTLGVAVVLPRGVLGAIGLARAARLEAHFPLALDDAYFVALARLHAASAHRTLPPLTVQLALDVLAYPQPLSPAAAAGLRALIAAAAGDAVEISLHAVGPEEDTAPEPLPGATHRLLVCDLASTPEPDLHGPLLRAAGRTPVALLLDESGYCERFGEGSTRMAERRASWLRFAADAGVRVLMLPLTAMDATAHAAALRRLLALDVDTPA